MNNAISVLDVIEDTTADGPGLRISIYAAGCPNACPGCHNPQSWDIDNGRWAKVDDLLLRVKGNDLSQVTFSGGDPFFQVEAFTVLARKIKEETRKNIWCYTGWRYEDIVASEKLSALLPYLDVLVDGRFEADERDESLLFRGSRNQRLIDVPLSLKENRLVLFDYNPYPVDL